jgi:DNA repair protein RadC
MPQYPVTYGTTRERIYVTNPGARRRRTHRVELPFSKYEDLRLRLALVRAPTAGKYPPVAITDSEVAANLLAPLINEPQEVMVVVCVDARNQVTGVVEVARGAMTSIALEPAIVFQPAIVSGAVSIIMAHNHPSGYAEPGEEDRMVARSMAEAGQTLGIRVLDFLVIGADGSYVSFADRGWL